MAIYTYQITNVSNNQQDFTVSNQTFHLTAQTTIHITVGVPITSLAAYFTIVQLNADGSTTTIQTADPIYVPSTQATEQTLQLVKSDLDNILIKINSVINNNNAIQSVIQNNAPRLSTTGNLAALNANVSLFVDGMSTGILQLSNTWSGIINLYGSLDNGVTYFQMNATPFGSGNSGASISNISTNGQWEYSVAGLTNVKAVMAVYSSGSASILLAAANGNKISRIKAPITDPLPVLNVATAFTDRSGTTSSSIGTFTQVAAANSNRQYFRVTNNSSSATLYLWDKSGSPTQAASISIPPLGSYAFNSKVSNTAMQIAASVASVAFEAAEG